MQKINKQWIFSMAMLLLFSVPVMAQTVTLGAKGKFSLMDHIMGGNVSCVSGNGKYLGGFFSPTQGFVYDIPHDTVYVLDMFVNGISNTMEAAGQYEVKAERDEAKVWRKGLYTTLPTAAPADADAYTKSNNVYGMSDDGLTIGGSGYEDIPESNKKIYKGILWRGDTVYKTLESYFPRPTDGNWQSYGARPNAISGNGKVAYGFSICRAGGPRVPVYWEGDKSYLLSTEAELANEDDGEVFGSNYDGSVLVGALNGRGKIWTKGKETITIEPLPGWKQTSAGGISENGVVLGYMTGIDFGDRTPFVWTKENGTLTLNEYLLEFYGINVGDKNLFTAYAISRDARVMAGYIFTSGARCSYLIQLDELPLNTRPLFLVAKQIKQSMNVQLSWKKPYKIANSVLGYNVYRDSVLLTKSPITTLTYIDLATPRGIHNYTITAVYADGESAFSQESKVQIVEPGGCYSVKYLRADLEYNRNLKLQWGLSSSEIVNESKYLTKTSESAEASAPHTFSFAQNPIFDVAPTSNLSKAPILNKQTSDNQSKINNADNQLDLVYIKNLKGYEKIVVTQIGDYYYADNWNVAGITKYNAQWQPIENIKIEGLPAVRGFATDGTSIYAVAGTKFIYELDFEYKTIVNTIPVPENARHITYIPELDNGNGGFEVGNYNTSVFIKKDGTKISDGLEGLVDASGAVYYKGKVYISQYTGKSNAEIHEYEVATKKATGFVFDFGQIPEVKDITSKYGGGTGGMTLITLEDSTVCLAPVMQVTYGENVVVMLELDSRPSLVGYNLYKNEVKVNQTPMKKRHYSEDLFQVGTYTYKVSAVFNNGCESELSYAQTVTIDTILPCYPIQSLHSVEQNKNVLLTFDLPAKNQQSQLLGFNVYRDAQRLNQELLIYTRYQDSAPSLGSHTYKVEAFYNNSCVASDSTTLEVTHQGSCSQPEYLIFKSVLKDPQAKIFNVNASWSAPFFEEPLSLRWGSGISARPIGLQGGKSLAVVVAWDSTQLNLYRDYSIIGMELILRDETTDVRPIVFLNEKLVYQESIGKTPINEFFNTYFEHPIPIGAQTYELALGYVVDYVDGKMPISMDNGPAKVGYGDLFTTDFEEWKQWGLASRDLRVNANWTIAAILAKTHDIASSTQGVNQNSSRGQGIIKVDIHSLQANTHEILTKEFAEPFYAPSETLSLTGFNIYRDETKLNASPLKNLNYIDSNLNEGTYAYKVSSLWNTCDEIFAETKNVKLSATSIQVDKSTNLSVYPNPVQDILNIQGEYLRVELFDSYGRQIYTLDNSAQTLSFKNLAKGLYTLRFINANGSVQSMKIVKK